LLNLLGPRLHGSDETRVFKYLSPLQQFVLHELAATADLPAAKGAERVARNLRRPPATLQAALGGLLDKYDDAQP
jgi:hypothetical protein